ncbi:hypothetical protein ACFCXT_23400 [Streptomyces vinaceus]|uniref:hypothetical protein n=1 Tax=Streptomyces vinaceus TaxID=1960 RepID=UPI0035E25F60
MAPIRNVVLVHGGFADGSGWQGVYDHLTADGYREAVARPRRIPGTDPEVGGGVLIGAAIATKLPRAVVLPGALPGVRRVRDAAAAVLLPAAAFAVLSYLPYVLLSHGSVFGYLSGYVEEEGYDDASAGSRYSLLRLVLPDTWAFPVLRVIVAAVSVSVSVYVMWRGDPQRPWSGALLVTECSFVLLTPGYSWYVLLLISLVALDGCREWLGIPLGGTAVHVLAPTLHFQPSLSNIACGTAVALVLVMTRVRRRAKARGPRPQPRRQDVHTGLNPHPSPLGDEQRVRFVSPPGLGEAEEAGRGGDAAHGCDLAVRDVERHRVDDLAARHEEEGGGDVDEREVHLEDPAGESLLRGRGPEAGPREGGDALRSVVPQQLVGKAGGVGDRGRVVGGQRHQPFGAALGGGGEEPLDDPAGRCRVESAAAAARREPAATCAVVTCRRHVSESR